MRQAQTQSPAHDLEARSAAIIPAGIQTSNIFVQHAQGATITDVDGRLYIDFAGGVGCLNLGHCNQNVIAKLIEQCDRYLHQGYSVVQYEPYIETAELLAKCHPGISEKEVKAFLLCSGVEAVEAAVKVARAATGRRAIICLSHAFHGRTALGATLTDKAWPFSISHAPERLDVYRCRAPYAYRGYSQDNAIEDFRTFLREVVEPSSIAAILYEPVQGEGGFLPLPDKYLLSISEECRRYGILLVADEIQSGVCRTGLPSASQHIPEVVPDLIVWGKSLGGGLPLSAVSGRTAVIDSVPVGAIASGTLGGNPLSCAAATAVLDLVLDLEFQQKCLKLGANIKMRLRYLADECPLIGDIRGVGAMQGFELVKDRESKEPAAEKTHALIAFCRSSGLLLKNCGIHSNVVRLLMPLTISESELVQGFDILSYGLRNL